MREAFKNATVQSSKVLAASGATLRGNDTGVQQGAGSGGGSAAAQRARLRQDAGGAAGVTGALLGRVAGGEARGGRQKGRKLTPAQRRAQRGAQAALSSRVCGSPAEDGCAGACSVQPCPCASQGRASLGHVVEVRSLQRCCASAS